MSDDIHPLGGSDAVACLPAAAIARVVLDWTAALSRPARPKSVRARLSAGVERLTEPVLAPVRRVLPPLRLGTFALDLSFIVVFLIVLLLRRVILSL